MLAIGARDAYWLENPTQAWLRAGRTEDRVEIASDYARNLSCYGLTQCFRNGPSLLLEAGVQLSRILLRVVGVDDDVAHRASIVALGSAWRLLMVGGFAVLSAQLLGLRSARGVLTVLSGITVMFAGFLLSESARVIVSAIQTMMPVHLAERVGRAFDDFPTESLIFYDYSHMVILPVLVLALPEVIHRKRADRTLRAALTVLVAGALLSSIFEFYGALFAVSIHLYAVQNGARDLWSHLRLAKRLTALLACGNAIWILFVVFMSRWGEMANLDSPDFRPDRSIRSQLSLLSSTAATYRSDNAANMGSLVLQIALLGVQAAIIGLLCRLSLPTPQPRAGGRHQQLERAAIALWLGFSLVTIGAFFNSGLGRELGRQTLGLQLATFLVVLLRRDRLCRHRFLTS